MNLMAHVAVLAPEERAELGRRGAEARWRKAKPGRKPAA